MTKLVRALVAGRRVGIARIDCTGRHLGRCRLLFLFQISLIGYIVSPLLLARTLGFGGFLVLVFAALLASGRLERQTGLG